MQYRYGTNDEFLPNYERDYKALYVNATYGAIHSQGSSRTNFLVRKLLKNCRAVQSQTQFVEISSLASGSPLVSFYTLTIFSYRFNR